MSANDPPGRNRVRRERNRQLPVTPSADGAQGRVEEHWVDTEGEDVSVVRGRLPGTRYVRIVRPRAREFSRQTPGYLVATERVLAPKGFIGGAADLLRRFLIGSRIRSEFEGEERLGKVKGLAVFASDNISSSAYATEETMRVLVLAGVAALTLAMPITLAVVTILAIVVISYREVIRAYPQGGGSYVVAHENLGKLAGMTAAAALLTDYTLTVAVSISAGTSAITSAFPGLLENKVQIAVGVVVVMTVLNLRGIRESGSIFAAPVYVYVLSILGLLGFGLLRLFMGTLPEYSAPPEWLESHGAEPLALLLVLRAFASGSVALTGTEAVADSVPSFRRPEVPNAQAILVMMGTLFATIFLGMSFLSGRMGIVPDPHEAETVVSQMTRTLVGGGTPYYLLIQFATAVLLLLAANTAFNGFPRLASILAKDRYLPRQFQSRGDRLAFTTGIVVLAAAGAALIAAYEGSVAGLIPLYTVGVFLAFTLSQMGLVRHWWQLRESESGWKARSFLNGFGALATGVVLIIVGVSKFALGAWMVLVAIPVLIAFMWAIQSHYRRVEDALTPGWPNVTVPESRAPVVIVPIARLDRPTLQALSFAKSISPEVRAVHVTDDPAEAEGMKQRWERSGGDVELIIVESPFRALISPLLAYIEAVRRQYPDELIVVVLAEFVPRHFWEHVLHNQTALRLKLSLFFRPGVVVADVPYHLSEEQETPAAAR
ncbi:MAG: APC family permease [Chloroflexi bacterium]|nr:APC family permease [Chloroflexota bacterium]